MILNRGSFPMIAPSHTGYTWEGLKASYTPEAITELIEEHHSAPSMLTETEFFGALQRFFMPYSTMVNELFAPVDHLDALSQFLINCLEEKNPPAMNTAEYMLHQNTLAKMRKQLTQFHAVMGFAGEVAEYSLGDSTENILEEQGDLLFYAIACHLAYGINMETLGTLPFPGEGMYKTDAFSTTLLLSTVDNGVDLLKKNFFYKQKDVEDLNFWMHFKTMFLYGTRGASTQDLYNVCCKFASIVRANMNKLSQRFPNLVFSSQDSIDRKDKVQSNGTEPACEEVQNVSAMPTGKSCIN
jgi:hypothetical protein